jgi:multimeric flavodoxin WrbA
MHICGTASARSGIKVERREGEGKPERRSVIAGLPYSFQGQMRLDEVTVGSPYGATTVAAGVRSRQPTANELEGAQFQGRQVALISNKLFG